MDRLARESLEQLVLGHLSNIGTIIYFGILIGGGSVAAHELFQRLSS